MNERHWRLARSLVLPVAVAALGLVLIGYRFAAGLGAVTNLSDGYPWGFWIAVDILVGIALASGGFVIAGAVYLFGQHRFHRIARPAILSALLGYLMFIFALAVDLGRPWHIWRALVSWNHASPMFEVAWCVMLYTGVLILEFAPAALEGLKLNRLRRLWYGVTPFVVIAMLTVFSFAMTSSVAWGTVTFLVFSSWEVLIRSNVIRRDSQMPLLLIVAGVTFSTLHQSSLGTLFLVVDRLSALWFTPILPHLFFLSAVMVAPAVIVLESSFSTRVLGKHQEFFLLRSLGRAMPYFISAYLVVRVGDLTLRGAVWETLTPSLQSIWFWIEIGLLLVAGSIFAQTDRPIQPHVLVVGAAATTGAVIVHRVGVAIVGFESPPFHTYVPAWSEVAITLGIIALGAIAFRLAVEFLPVYDTRAEVAREFMATVPVQAGAVVGHVGQEA